MRIVYEVMNHDYFSVPELSVCGSLDASGETALEFVGMGTVAAFGAVCRAATDEIFAGMGGVAGGQMAK